MNKTSGKAEVTATAETFYRTLRQYSRGRIPAEDMEKLLEVARDCRRVKEQVYTRYGGIGGLNKLYPGYTIQKEMAQSGLREQLGLPSVYFNLSIFEALGDIKARWTLTKAKILELTGRNASLKEAEKHYLRFVVRTGNVFAAALTGEPAPLPGELQKNYENLAGRVDTGKLTRYLRRQVRRHHGRTFHTGTGEGFPASERAYRYGDHGIYLTTKENRRRVFIPLTDNGRHKSQIRVMLFPDEGRAEILAAVERTVKEPVKKRGESTDPDSRTGIALGMQVMLTTDMGHRYGEAYGELQSRYADWIREQAVKHGRDRGENTGRKKYRAKKRRLQEGLHSYINRELNRFLCEEKPERVYMMEPPGAGSIGKDRRRNNRAALWERGYIRRRLEYKCREQSILLTRVSGQGAADVCSRCGAAGERKDGLFVCGSCGQSLDEKVNTAGNILKRGLEKESVS